VVVLLQLFSHLLQLDPPGAVSLWAVLLCVELADCSGDPSAAHGDALARPPWMFFPNIVPLGHPIFDVIDSTHPEVTYPEGPKPGITHPEVTYCAPGPPHLRRHRLHTPRGNIPRGPQARNHTSRGHILCPWATQSSTSFDSTHPEVTYPEGPKPGITHPEVTYCAPGPPHLRRHRLHTPRGNIPRGPKARNHTSRGHILCPWATPIFDAIDSTHPEVTYPEGPKPGITHPEVTYCAPGPPPSSTSSTPHQR